MVQENTDRDRLRILLLDDDPDMRALVRAHLAKELPRAHVVMLDPANDSLPSPGDISTTYDCVLLDYDWGPGGSGLDWLRTYGRLSEQSPVILLTGAEDVYVAARAMKLGAEDYLNKRDLTARRLAELITSATAERSEHPGRPAKAAPEAVSKPVFSKPAARPDIEGYEIGELVGRGATAQVFLAERTEDGLTVVVKLLKGHLLEASEDRVGRFIREAELVAQLDSPQIVRIYEQQFTDDFAYIAMEYLPGGDLRDRIGTGVEGPEAVRVMRELLLGLKAIHDIGVIHRDMKPGNIMFRKDGSLAIADFGLSRRIDGSNDLTMSGQIMGTPAYMSPEQGQGDVATISSDLYSAGVIFFELLMGHKPYEAASPTGVIYKHIKAPIPKLSEANAFLQPVIDALMAKEPDDRPADAGAAIALCDATVDRHLTGEPES